MNGPNQSRWFGMDSSGGRIGPFWWINSDTRPMPYFGPEVAIRFVIWGSCGFNPNQMRVHLKPIDEPC
jgi:hypothetical protein